MIEVAFVSFLGILFSTIDSFLHAGGVLFVQDIFIPLRRKFGFVPITSYQKATYARFSIAFLGCVAIVIGLMQSAGSWRNDVLFGLYFWLYTLLIIPLIIGVVGIKTNKSSWVSFCVVYLGINTYLRRMGLHKYDSFLISVPMGLVAFFLLHIYCNGGIVTLKRSSLTTAEHLWFPNWKQIPKKLRYWIAMPFHLPTIAEKKAGYGVMQPLTFSLLMMALYTFSILIKRGGSVETVSFMVGVYVMGITLCVGLMIEEIWPTSLKAYVPLYWFISLCYCLPFASTLVFLRIHESPMDASFWIMSFILLGGLVDSGSFLVLSLWGVGLAFLGWYLRMGSLPVALWDHHISALLCIFVIFVSVCLFERKKERNIKSKLYFNQVAMSGVKHEVDGALQKIVGIANVLEGTLTHGKKMKGEEGKDGFWMPKERYDFLKNNAEGILTNAEQVDKELKHFANLLKQQVMGGFSQEVVEMHDFMKELIGMLPKSYTAHVKVELVCKKDFKVKIVAVMFHNIIFNLVKNAYKHGRASLVKISIDGQHCKLYVHDNGGGIAAEELPYIFDLYYTGSQSSGIGLALAKIIVEASGGKISCCSRHGGKSSFTEFEISFPAIK